MRYAIIGAGAIGAYVGASLCRSGAEVTLVARGSHGSAMRDQGVLVRSARGDFHVCPRVTDRIEDVGTVDVVILAVKAHQIAPIAASLRTLFDDQTTVVTMQNGIPWWYFHGHGGALDGHPVLSADPDGAIAASIEPERIVGSVIYSSTEIVAPGVILHVEGTRYSLGEPNRTQSLRVQRIADGFVAGGLKAPVETDIRRDIWIKILGNASFNPISALTRATLQEMTDDAHVEPLVREMMGESLAIATALGVEIGITIDKRIDGARRVGHHKTSMLQDLEAQKTFELDALVGAVVELGELTGVPTPATRHVYALAKLLERSLFRPQEARPGAHINVVPPVPAPPQLAATG